MSHRRILVPLAIAGAIAGAAPTTVAAAPSDPPGCFGQAVSGDGPSAPPDADDFGQEVSTTARAVKLEGGSFGADIVPGFRSEVCG
jgi:hypothetical protein